MPRVRDIMTQEVATLDRNDALTIADDVMKLGRIRHLPVVDEDGKLAGVVSQRDLFRGALARTLGYGTHGQDRLLALLKVKDVMSTPARTIDPDVSLREAAILMFDEKIGCLIAVDAAGAPVGILTEGDFVALVAKGDPS